MKSGKNMKIKTDSYVGVSDTEVFKSMVIIFKYTQNIKNSIKELKTLNQKLKK